MKGGSTAEGVSGMLGDFDSLASLPSHHFTLESTTMSELLLLPTEIPADMIMRIAQGLDEPETIAAQYGVDAVRYAALEQQDWFRGAIFAKQDELKKNGFQLRYKATLYAENLMEHVYKHAQVEDIRLGDRLDALKYFSDIAGLKPKDTATTGPGFSITIDMGDSDKNISLSSNPLHADPAPEEIPLVVDVPVFEPSAYAADNEDLTYNLPADAPEEEGLRMMLPEFDL